MIKLVCNIYLWGPVNFMNMRAAGSAPIKRSFFHIKRRRELWCDIINHNHVDMNPFIIVGVHFPPGSRNKCGPSTARRCAAAPRRPFVSTHFLHNKAICGRVAPLEQHVISRVHFSRCVAQRVRQRNPRRVAQRAPIDDRLKAKRRPWQWIECASAGTPAGNYSYKRCTTDASADDRCAVSAMRARYLRADGYRHARSIALSVTGRL